MFKLQTFFLLKKIEKVIKIFKSMTYELRLIDYETHIGPVHHP